VRFHISEVPLYRFWGKFLKSKTRTRPFLQIISRSIVCLNPPRNAPLVSVGVYDFLPNNIFPFGGKIALTTAPPMLGSSFILRGGKRCIGHLFRSFRENACFCFLELRNPPLRNISFSVKEVSLFPFFYFLIHCVVSPTTRIEAHTEG
jgi:hypothetical protein